MYRVKSITNRDGDVWDWIITLGGDTRDTFLSVRTPGATMESMWERAETKCRRMNEYYGFKEPLEHRNIYQARMTQRLLPHKRKKS